MLRQSGGAAQWVVEHGGLVWQLDETRDPAQDGLWLRDELLETNLHVVGHEPRFGSGALYPGGPFPGQRAYVIAGREPGLAPGERHVSAVPDDVYEACLWQQPRDNAHQLGVNGRLVARSLLPEPPRVETVKGSEAVAHIEAR